MPSSLNVFFSSGGLLLRSLGTHGFRDVARPATSPTEINLAVSDRAQGKRKRPSNQTRQASLLSSFLSACARSVISVTKQKRMGLRRVPNQSWRFNITIHVLI